MRIIIIFTNKNKGSGHTNKRIYFIFLFIKEAPDSFLPAA